MQTFVLAGLGDSCTAWSSVGGCEASCTTPSDLGLLPRPVRDDIFPVYRLITVSTQTKNERTEPVAVYDWLKHGHKSTTAAEHTNEIN